MKRQLIILAILATAVIGSRAQSLLVESNGVTYSFPANLTGDMTYSGGTSLTILDKVFLLSDVQSMKVEDIEVERNTINITYAGSAATVLVDGLVARYVDVDVAGAHVSVTQHSNYAEELTYTLSGASDNGSFLTTGSYKSTIELHGLTLTNPSGAAISIQNGKRNNFSVKEGTVNTLTDGAGGTQKGALACKGHLEIKGKGSLTVSGKTSDAIHASEYITLKNTSITITSAVKDGINCNQYFTMESGSLNISDTGDEGLQVGYKDESNRDADDTGELTVLGGTITTNTAGKGIKADGNITISGGDINVYTTGSGAEGIESKSQLYIRGGSVYVNAYDDGINSTGHMYISGGTITAISRNNDALDSNCNLYIQGGTIMALGGRAPECGIDANEEAGYSVVFTGGTLLAVGGSNSTPSTSASTQPYVSGSLSVSAGNNITLKSGNTELASFVIPEGYSMSFSGGGFGGGFGGGMGGRSGSVLITCTGLTSGNTYTLSNGSSSSSVTAALRGSSSGGGRPW